MKLKNMKASFLFGENLLKKKSGAKKIIFKQRGVIYTVYKHTPNLLNVTGLKSFEKMKNERLEMEKYFEKYIIKIRIDSLFFSEKNYENIDLHAIERFLKNNEKFIVNYHQELFPGMHLLPKEKKYPTIGLFRTGSFTMMGSTDMSSIVESEAFIHSLIQQFRRILRPQP